MCKMIKVAKAQGSMGSALSFSNLWYLAAPLFPSSETQQWPEITTPGPGPLGKAPGWWGPHSALSLQETQAHLLIRNQDDAGHTLHLPRLRSQDYLVLLDQLGGKVHTGQLTSVVFIHCPPLHTPTLASLPPLPEASFTPPWPTYLLPLPTHPCQQQLHLQLCNPAAQASPDPIAKGHRAKWVLDPEGIRLTLLQPAMGMEALCLREDARVPGHHIVAEHKLGLQRKNGQHIS